MIIITYHLRSKRAMITDSNTNTCQWVRRVLMVLVLLVCVGDSFLFRGISRGGNRMISSSVYRQRLYSGTKTQDVVKKMLVSEDQQGKESSGT